MRIFFITPEALPCSRVGGLGDVSYHLPKALSARGHEVTVLVPKHRLADKLILTPLPELTSSINLSISRRTAEYFQHDVPGSHNLILVGCDDYYDRPGIYGNEFGDYDDNAERFIFFSQAAFAAVEKLTDFNRPTAVHSHDWTTGLVPMLFKVRSGDNSALASVGTVFTYHNLANQGTFPYYDFAMTGLDWSYFTYQGLEFHGNLNLTKAGLLGAHIITTVSHRYARESLSSEGRGLEGVLKERLKDIRSVLHGVDYGLWNPASDIYVPANYDCQDLAGKAVCRQNLSRLFGLSDDERPIVAVVSRLLARKGLDLIAKAMPDLLNLKAKIVFMGTGDDHFISILRETAAANPGKIGLKLSYDPALTHQIMAGADMYLAPSRFEPCGLEQLYALKYGAVPVVRATGGLDDTVEDELTKPGSGTGYKFNEYTPEALTDALAKAIDDYGRADVWRSLMLRSMQEDYSWERAALAYEDIYAQALEAVGDRRRQGDS
ncbi:MAG: glycogen synthase [Deltaproteobacteria bacterium]|jgi:starch synthase|nr:glycogen synthase [Deltaproteobacteria bacterium]